LEPLEDRLVLTTFNVSNLADSGPGSLRQAIVDANTQTGADVINFAPGLHGTITLTSGELDITDDLTVNGPGAKVLTVSGNNTYRNFVVASHETVSISGLTIANGNAGSGDGGGLDNFGTVTVSNSVFISNSAGALGGGLFNNSDSTAGVIGCTFTSNAAATAGGGLANESGGTARVSGSSFTANSAT
jgi:hypothetical protein